MSYQQKNPDEQYSKTDEEVAFYRALQATLSDPADKEWMKKDYRTLLNRATRVLQANSSTLMLGISKRSLKHCLSSFEEISTEDFKRILEKIFLKTAVAIYYIDRENEIRDLSKALSSKSSVQDSWNSKEISSNSQESLEVILSQALCDVHSQIFGSSPYSMMTKFNSSLTDEECAKLCSRFFKEDVNPRRSTIAYPNLEEWLRKNFHAIQIFISEHDRNLILPSLECRKSVLKMIFTDLLWIAIRLSEKEKVSFYVEVTESDLSIRTVCFSSKLNLQYNFQYYYTWDKASLAESVLTELKGCSFRSVIEEDFCIQTEATIPLTLLF